MALPSTGQRAAPLSPSHYDLAQLKRAVANAPTDKLAEADKSLSGHCHVHTLTLHLSLQPEEEFQEYPDGPRENPSFQTFKDVSRAVAEATTMVSPLVLSHPHSDMIHLPFSLADATKETKRTAYLHSAHISLPSGRRGRPLVKLPDVIHRFHGCYANGALSTSWDSYWWIHAALSLDPDEPPTRKGAYRGSGKPITFHTGVCAAWMPDESMAAGGDLQLLVTIEAFLDVNQLGVDMPPVGAGLFGFVLQAIIPSDTEEQNTATESLPAQRAVALRAFYDTMSPAPALPPTMDMSTLQPEGLRCRLFPFQRRTLALLLEHEGKRTTGRKPNAARSGQWQVVHFEGHGDYAYRRLTGEIVPLTIDKKGKGLAMSTEALVDRLPPLFDLSSVRGTMLCEEMGLGKTVEAIALILLHRHPLSIPRPLQSAEAQEAITVDLRTAVDDLYSPDDLAWLQSEEAAFAHTKVWSEESQLHVSETAATLVVTPQSLLKQWMGEIKKHAPHLRVCVYPGWKSLISQIKEQRRKRELKAQRLAMKRQREATKMKEEARKRRRLARVLQQDSDAGDVKPKIEEFAPSTSVSTPNLDSDDEAPDDVEDSLLALTQTSWLHYVRGHDVVLTTYATLSEDLAVAIPAPSRSRRSTAKYDIHERPRSPLVMVEWWRVIMDEVQLHSNASTAAAMVSLVPRKLSLAMSGTPAKADIRDLMSSLRFLRVPIHDNTLWARLTHIANQSALHGLVRALSVRTTKAEVAGEFNIPPQTRYIVPVELSRIEMHYYLDTLERQRQLLRGRNDQELATALRHLRQICTHIQVGALRQLGQPLERAGRLHLGNRLMTMDEALGKMRSDHEQDLVNSTRMQARFLVRKGQLLMQDDTDDLRYHRALLVYDRARGLCDELLGPARAHLSKLLGDREDNLEDDDEGDRPTSIVERDKIRDLQLARSAIREAQLIKHQTAFLRGDVHHQLAEEELEVDWYAQAQQIRTDILSRPKAAAERSVESMDNALSKQPPFPDLEHLKIGDMDWFAGILSAETINQLDSLLEIMDSNADLVEGWRAMVIKMLRTPIEADDDELPAVGEGQKVENPDEEYYAKVLQVQGEVEAYMWAYSAILSDRREMLHEERTLLAEHEGTLTTKRKTQRAKDAGAVPDNDLGRADFEEIRDRLAAERNQLRQRRVEEDCQRPVKALLVDLNAIEHGAHRAEETEIARKTAADVRKYVKLQTEYLDKLQKELELFRAIFNKRVLYFAALQEISDSVAYPPFRHLRREIASLDERIIALDVSLGTMAIRGRYLAFLGSGEKREDRDDCVICFGTSDDSFANVLPCGHTFCVSCLKEYRKSSHPSRSRRCPTCKAPFNQVTRVRIRGEDEGKSTGSQEAPGVDDEVEPEADGEDAADSAEREANLARLRFLPESKLRELDVVDFMGEWGSKINMLIRHLKYDLITKPKLRHVVFSNWRDSLSIVEKALDANHIKYVCLDRTTKKNDVVERFHADPTIAVFLLHAERESAGLTLTSCGAVHLLEPVLQHSFELQAIGRVDRLGQDQPTTVYCYATLDTVESRILSNGVRNGTSIYLADQEEDRAAMSRLETAGAVAAAADRGGDIRTVASNGDELWKLIF